MAPFIRLCRKAIKWSIAGHAFARLAGFNLDYVYYPAASTSITMTNEFRNLVGRVTPACGPKPKKDQGWATLRRGEGPCAPQPGSSLPVPIVKPRRINGRLRGADVKLSRETIAAAVRADRDQR
jgi:hypothetical protein